MTLRTSLPPWECQNANKRQLSPVPKTALLQDIWLIEKLAHFDREVIP